MKKHYIFLKIYFNLTYKGWIEWNEVIIYFLYSSILVMKKIVWTKEKHSKQQIYEMSCRQTFFLFGKDWIKTTKKKQTTKNLFDDVD